MLIGAGEFIHKINLGLSDFMAVNPRDACALVMYLEHDFGGFLLRLPEEPFQDQEGQKASYKFGSLSHVDASCRQQAIEHNMEVIDYGKALGSKSITVWLADGSSFPGQSNFRRALQNTQDSLKQIYAHMPSDWRMFIEYKPYEPQFYSTVIQDWGTSLMLAEGCGEKAFWANRIRVMESFPPENKIAGLSN